jgi:hypothetical protein
MNVETLKRFWSYVSANKRMLAADLYDIDEQLKKDLLPTALSDRARKVIAARAERDRVGVAQRCERRNRAILFHMSGDHSACEQGVCRHVTNLVAQARTAGVVPGAGTPHSSAASSSPSTDTSAAPVLDATDDTNASPVLDATNGTNASPVLDATDGTNASPVRDATNDAEEDVVAMWDVIMGFDGRDPEVFTPELHQYVATMLHRKLHPKKLRELATSVGTNHNENLWSMLVKFSHGKSLNQSGKFTWYNYACLAGKAQNVGWPKTILGMLDSIKLDDTLVARNAREIQADFAGYLRERERKPESIQKRSQSSKKRKENANAAVTDDRESAYTKSGEKMGRKTRKTTVKPPVPASTAQKCTSCHRVPTNDGSVHDCENAQPKYAGHATDREEADIAEAVRLTSSV